MQGPNLSLPGIGIEWNNLRYVILEERSVFADLSFKARHGGSIFALIGLAKAWHRGLILAPDKLRNSIRIRITAERISSCLYLCLAPQPS